jgi:hypothetical protein
MTASTEMTTFLVTYEDFLARVETLGFMPLSQLFPGLPSLGGETPESLWHTGLDTDPWRWKDRAAEEKRLAYGCILGGHKGFVTQRMYPIFYAAYCPAISMPDRWAEGIVSQTTWQVWQLFEEHHTLNISQVRQMMGVSRKQGAGAVDTAIKQLQRDFYITMDGNDRKVSAGGEFYGWPVNRYARVEEWAPGWLDTAKDWTAQDARELILDDGTSMLNGADRKSLANKLGLL